MSGGPGLDSWASCEHHSRHLAARDQPRPAPARARLV